MMKKFRYTKNNSKPEGWQFIVDPQNRTGTGYVFSSQHVSIKALEQFKFGLYRKPYKNIEPRLLKWKPKENLER